jgi:hypothetical protein
MSIPELPPLMDESNLRGERKLKRERELLDLAVKRAQERLKEIEKRKKETE